MKTFTALFLIWFAFPAHAEMDNTCYTDCRLAGHDSGYCGSRFFQCMDDNAGNYTYCSQNSCWYDDNCSIGIFKNCMKEHNYQGYAYCKDECEQA